MLQNVDDIKPIVTDRPDFTESSSVVPKGSLQFESGFTNQSPSRGIKSISGPEVLLRYGLTDRFELRLGLPNYNRIDGGGSRLEGFGDTYLGVKLALGANPGGTEFALIPAVFVPTGRHGIRSESASPEIKFVYSHGLDKGCSLSGMLYVASVEDSGKRVTPVQHTISLGIPVRERVGMFIEHVLDIQRGSKPGQTLHSGFTFQPRPNAQFDIHYGFGLTRNAPDFFIGAGYSIRF